jgi:hypothetical protein
MDDKEVALAACDSAQKDHFAKVAGIFVDEFSMAEGNPNAAQLRQEAGNRFKAVLLVYKAAHDASRALVEEVFPGT